jgi:hypothetical protein
LAEDETANLLDEIVSDSKRKGNCSVCHWLEDRDDAAEWDSVMALTWQQANSRAIHRAMVKRGFEAGDKTVEYHRKRSHRVSA